MLAQSGPDSPARGDGTPQRKMPGQVSGSHPPRTPARYGRAGNSKTVTAANVCESSSGHSAPSLLTTTFLGPLWPHLAGMGAPRLWQPAQAQSWPGYEPGWSDQGGNQNSGLRCNTRAVWPQTRLYPSGTRFPPLNRT